MPALFTVLVMVAAITLITTRCGSETVVSETADQIEVDPYADVVADMSLVPDDLDEELVAELETLAASDGRVAYIINTIGTVFGDDSSEQVSRFLKLVVDDSESIDFVVGLVDNYPQEEGQPYDEEVEAGTVPLLLQWDVRWGYTQYCAESFAAAGCGPTSFAMVYMGLTGDTSLTPYDMGVYATEHGYAVDYQGTIGADFFFAISAELGLNCASFSPDSSTLEWYLNNGYVVISNVGPGDFTTSGHFIVITGINDEGELIINDPYSTVRSTQTWDIDRVINQSRTLFAFSLA